MRLHPSTFKYHQPTPDQIQLMTLLREAAKTYAERLEKLLPDGPDKTYCLRKLRTVAMWSNVAVTRAADGTPIGE